MRPEPPGRPRARLGAAAAVTLLATGCTAPGSVASTGPRAGSGSPSPTSVARDLGPEPGAAAYRALDLCALAPAAAVRTRWATTAIGAQIPPLRSEGPGAGSCVLAIGDPPDYLTVAVASGRAWLPTEVTTTDPGLSTVVDLPGGASVRDPSCATAAVLSDVGYVLALEIQGTSLGTGACALLDAVAGVALERIDTPAAQSPPPDGSPLAVDLCEVVAASGVLDRLPVTPPLATRADGRLCRTASADAGFSELAFTILRGGSFPAGYRGVIRTRVGVRAAFDASGSVTCQLLVPLGGERRWSLLVRGSPRAEADCAQLADGLGPLVDRLP